MSIKISKKYEENIQVGKWTFAKIGLTIHSDKEIKSVGELKDYSEQLGKLAKTLVREELQKLKEEKSEEVEY